MVETTKINMLVSLELNKEKDSLKQRDSGLNVALAKTAVKNKIEILINFSEITKFNENKKIKAKVLAKLMQNISTCRKAKCKIKIASFAQNKSELADDYQRKSFLLSLGADTKMASESVVF